MKIIVLSGKAENGKDTFSKLLLTHLGTSVIKVAFGDELKYVAERAFGWCGGKRIEDRQLFQDIGDTGRKYNPLIWITPVVQELELAKATNTEVALVTDARYENEIETLKKTFGNVTTIRIERFGHLSNLTEEQKAHPGETELDTYEFDYVIHNNTTIEAMLNEAEYIAKEVLGE